MPEGGCDGLETWANIYPDFHHFPSEMCRQAGFFNGGETVPRPVFFAKPVLALASYYILSRSNERLTFSETRLCV